VFECDNPDTSIWLSRSMSSLENQLNFRNLRAVALSATTTNPRSDPPPDGSSLSVEA